MKLHANARLSVKGRELLIERIEVAGWSLAESAAAAGVSERTAGKWLARYRAEGVAGPHCHSSAPATVANRTDERRIEAIAALRRLRLTGAEIAEPSGPARADPGTGWKTTERDEDDREGQHERAAALLSISSVLGVERPGLPRR